MLPDLCAAIHREVIQRFNSLDDLFADALGPLQANLLAELQETHGGLSLLFARIRKREGPLHLT